MVVACGVEVLVDWNQALFEINVLRDQIRQKGQNYAGLLSRVVVDPMQRGHMGTLDRLSAAILDDEDAIYVRLTDVDGKQVYDRIDKNFEKTYEKLGHGTFRKHFGYFLDRDMRGMTADPEVFKQHLANSRYRDLPQIWADSMAHVMAAILPPEPRKPSSREVVYQDRLRDENRKRDDSITWAVAPLELNGKRVGAVLVAFDMMRINRAARSKALKALGMVIFFVGLLLAQNIAARRDKLRLLDIEARHRGTKDALRAALPQAPVELDALYAHGALEQARGYVDGMVWDVRKDVGEDGTADRLTLLIVDPDGDGIEAAAVGLHTLRTFRAAGPRAATTAAELAALGEASASIPLARPIATLLLRVQKNGDFSGIVSDFAELQILREQEGRVSVSAVPLEPISTEVAPGIVGPLFECRGTLLPGDTLFIACAGKNAKDEKDAQVDGAIFNRYLSRRRVGEKGDKRDPLRLPLDELALLLRAKQPALSQNDIAVVAVHRA